MPNYVIHTKAYLKIILHACKHPFAGVNGILLAEDSEIDNEIRIVDAVPLFHRWVTLTPMLEIGLQQVDVYASKNNLKIAGYYHANERVDDNKLPLYGQKIVSKIHDNFNKAIALVVQNTKLSPENPEIAVVPYTFKENQWRPDNKAFSSKTESSTANSFSFENPNAPDLISQSIQKRHFEHLYDFDEHMENIELDWLVNQKVESLEIENDKKRK
ncbi:3564_t:CDS:2 [Acaulospora morrowiae]|uniref:3564_t:CDS:1 n=1 Tax=Acaulospora morrowiae TaxID=94023 RepID=A0A9N9F353_9GLOM|nr:3564_t:CDS:2 [Acaulospora morrowiae]